MDGYTPRFYQFAERPLSDSCWSLSTGPDGRIYGAACIEHTGGQSVSIVRYRERTDSLEYLFDMDEVSGDLRDSGRATQCKIHYSFAPSARDGILYAATHLSGAPKGEQSYCPWSSWHDPVRAFKGSFVAAYDTAREEVAWCALMIPKEGCRCLCLDEERGWLYAITYPRDHFVIFDTRTRKLTDLGRIGSVNSQCIFLDQRRRACFSDDHGHLVRFDPDRMALETLPFVIPHSWYQNGWHGVLYDAVACPNPDDAGDCVYMVPWMVNPRLMRFWPQEGPHGRMEDLGPVNQERDTTLPVSMSLDHSGGLVFGLDGMLYWVKARWAPGDEAQSKGMWSYHGVGVLVRMDPRTLEREDVCVLERENSCSHYVSRGARDHAGNLYFGHIGPAPVGLFRVTVPGAGQRPDAHLPLRVWG